MKTYIAIAINKEIQKNNYIPVSHTTMVAKYRNAKDEQDAWQEYQGFINNTEVTITHKAISKKQLGRLCFGKDRDFVAIDVEFCGHKTNTTIATENSSAWPSVTVNQPEKWPKGLALNTDRFDCITLEMKKGYSLRVTNVSITLNGKDLLDRVFGRERGLLVDENNPLFLKFFVGVYRNKQVFSDYHTPAAIVELICNDIYKSWDPKYCERVEGASEKNYSAEYANWVIWKSTSFRYHAEHDGLRKPIDIVKLFSDKNSLISSKNTEFAKIGDVVEPGFFVTFQKRELCGFFIRWIESKSDWTTTTFKPNGRNYFLTVGMKGLDSLIEPRAYSFVRTGSADLVWKDGDDYFGNTNTQNW